MWKSIVNYEGYYEVSETGDVRSVDRFIKYPKHTQIARGRILALNQNKKGHLYVRLWREGVGKTYSVHRLVAAAFISKRPFGMQIHHKDYDSTNNRVENLEYLANLEHVYKHYKVAVVNKEVVNNEVVNNDGVVYESILQAALATKCTPDQIRRACKYKHRFAGGLGWKFTDDWTGEQWVVTPWWLGVWVGSS